MQKAVTIMHVRSVDSAKSKRQLGTWYRLHYLHDEDLLMAGRSLGECKLDLQACENCDCIA